MKRAYVKLEKSSTSFVEFRVVNENGQECGTLFYTMKENECWTRSGDIPIELDGEMKYLKLLALEIIRGNARKSEEKEGT